MRTRQLSPLEVIPLRHEVLRPGKPRETAVFAGDELESTTHWGACTDDGRIMAVATLMRSPKPGQAAPAWQVRGMASAPEARGQGYGAAVLQAVMDYVVGQEPGALIWCNARVVALGFYRAQGFETEGPEFEIAGVGPHFVMWRKL
jgi:predicted GNAT family N-acyltransferase